MLAILSVLVIVALSVLVTRVATVALTHTGLSRESARFQARSAFTGVGFTTFEAEMVVNHPVRRRIMMLLMLLGNAGIVSVIGSLIISFARVGEQTRWFMRIGVLAGGAALLWMLASSEVVDRWLSRVISRALVKWTDLDVRDYGELLHLRGEFRVRELRIEPGDWIAGQALAEAALRKEGLTVLGIERANGTYIGTPKGDTRIEPGDVLILYGRAACVQNLDTRREGHAGEREHAEAVAAQEQAERREAEEDREAEENREAEESGDEKAGGAGGGTEAA